MGVQKLGTLPKEAVPLTRHTDIKLVLDTPKGMFFLFYSISFSPLHLRYDKERGRKSEAEEGRRGKRRKEEEKDHIKVVYHGGVSVFLLFLSQI